MHIHTSVSVYHLFRDAIKSSNFLRASGDKCAALSSNDCRPIVEMKASHKEQAATRLSPVRGALAESRCHSTGSTCLETNWGFCSNVYTVRSEEEVIYVVTVNPHTSIIWWVIFWGYYSPANLLIMMGRTRAFPNCALLAIGWMRWAGSVMRQYVTLRVACYQPKSACHHK